MSKRTKLPKKADIKKFKPVEIKKVKKEENKKLEDSKKEVKKSEEPKKEEQLETKKQITRENIDTLDSIAREEKKRKDREEKESLKDLDKEKMFEEDAEFIPETNSNTEEKIENLEEFASTLPSVNRDIKFDNPYSATNNLYVGSSYSINPQDISGNYSAKAINADTSLGQDRRVNFPFSSGNTNSQNDYESKQREAINRNFEERRREMEESHINPNQRKSNKTQLF